MQWEVRPFLPKQLRLKAVDIILPPAALDYLKTIFDGFQTLDYLGGHDFDP